MNSSSTVLKPAAPSVQEFSIKVPKNSKKKHNVMRFNATLDVDFSKWTQVKMERENNMKEYKGMEEEIPKFGAGSEFGRDAREEARRKKFGITSRKYKPEDQPWILKAGGKTGKKFKGIREGGISENAAYYVFTHATDGVIEAFPLHEWYNFQPIQRYKALSAEEAEQEFSRRNRVMNYFSLMLRKRLRNDEDGGDDDELVESGKSKRPSKKEKELKISEMDDWMDSDDDESGSNEEENKKGSDDEDDAKKKKGKGQTVQKKKKKKNASDDEAFEESDDGDEEGRECDYISDSSDSESELEQQKEIKSVAEEDALRKLLASDEEEDDEEQTDKKEGEEDKDDDEEGKEKDDKDKDKLGKESDKRKDKKKKKKAKKKDLKKSSSGKDSSSDFSSDSESDSDTTLKEKDNKKPNSAHSSRSATPTPAASDPLKRKQTGSPDLSQAKKLKLDNFNLVPTSYIPGASESGITEDAVRRYLMRKPMTTTELLQKFKSKKTGLTSEQLVNIMTQILKKINPTKQTIKNKMYLSIKAQSN
ncbi:PREDICTED: general transcription factor IIF subunit 1 [Dinoponera quadriceps]|uniref:Transcription initiation factor IIF subunit alpha n=1 Tax=Dinoponera quadriceps TaxID=609295 RepID=A0A6P3WW80_DINQU|nr:PREDICTED: general transcription factor IIF subunit 1 [Dinoponera quadriceps]